MSIASEWNEKLRQSPQDPGDMWFVLCVDLRALVDDALELHRRDLRTLVTQSLEAERLGKRVELLEKALREIAEGRGPFAHDKYEHACNVIEAMKALADKALKP